MMKAIAVLFFFIILLLLYRHAHAEADHAQFHGYYQNWVNRNGVGCCNNNDCRTLKDQDERTTPIGIEVQVEGHWCSVKPEHYLKSGNAPDYSSAHICVTPNYSGVVASPCERLRCYQPRPQS